MKGSLDRILKDMAMREREKDRGTWRGELRARYAPWLDDLAYGFEVKPGWQALIEDTMQEIAHIVGGPQGCPELRITRLRQKFGILTAQFRGLSGEQEKAVEGIFYDAGDRSMQICEWCGKPGDLHGADFDWWTVECEEHSGKSGRERR